MTSGDRVHRNRCFGLGVAVVFAVILAGLGRRDWAAFGVAVAGGLVALGVYVRDCRSSARKPTQADTHRRDS
jgi:Flp pilus assembly protein TadB